MTFGCVITKWKLFTVNYNAQGQTFSFPDLFPEKEQASTEGSVEEMQEKFMEDEKQRQKPDPRRGGVTEWFGL
ncbi:39S ribosomal protein L23, mitochondrial [Liparis tanakae]|uniref:39S ribosomal protein L23, mitochondrial n=1 Tax=Liparis tanakae TaxID=230148 RepID=A0A4Z2JCC9_9TELE|nr:39S ribosomal protein L23, mitochondrial [Liparis tanakae]